MIHARFEVVFDGLSEMLQFPREVVVFLLEELGLVSDGLALFLALPELFLSSPYL